MGDGSVSSRPTLSSSSSDGKDGGNKAELLRLVLAQGETERLSQQQQQWQPETIHKHSPKLDSADCQLNHWPNNRRCAGADLVGSGPIRKSNSEDKSFAQVGFTTSPLMVLKPLSASDCDSRNTMETSESPCVNHLDKGKKASEMADDDDDSNRAGSSGSNGFNSEEIVENSTSALTNGIFAAPNVVLKAFETTLTKGESCDGGQNKISESKNNLTVASLQAKPRKLWRAKLATLVTFSKKSKEQVNKSTTESKSERATIKAEQEQAQSLAVKSVIIRQARNVNSLMSIKLKTLLTLISLVVLIHSSCLRVQAGFWTFYLPNFLKPSGYKELTYMIHELEREMNLIKDTFADTQYFWGLLQRVDKIPEDDVYPEESACTEVLPLFRELAIEYAYIDYEHYLKPMEQYHEHLVMFRSKWFPEGEKTKTILPREWEQNLQEKGLELKISWHHKLTTEPEYKSKRERLVNIWLGVKRSLDASLTCLHLRYAFRQSAEDINQLALEMNLDAMHRTLEMLQSAYKRIDKFKSSDAAAIRQIDEVLERQEKL